MLGVETFTLLHLSLLKCGLGARLMTVTLLLPIPHNVPSIFGMWHTYLSLLYKMILLTIFTSSETCSEVTKIAEKAGIKSSD